MPLMPENGMLAKQQSRDGACARCSARWARHQDVGQMDMYVRMYDERVRGEGDNPTLGIVLCSETDEDIARYSTTAISYLRQNMHRTSLLKMSFVPRLKRRSTSSHCNNRKRKARKDLHDR